MFEEFVDKYFMPDEFLELINACFNDSGIYFERNNANGIRRLSIFCHDRPAVARNLLLQQDALLAMTKKGCRYIVAMPFAGEFFAAPYSAIVDKCFGEVTFLCGFERVFREREEKKSKLTEIQREEITAVIKILACAARAETNWEDVESIKALISSEDACTCVGYDIVQYFYAYKIGLTKFYLKDFLSCIKELGNKELSFLIAMRLRDSV